MLEVLKNLWETSGFAQFFLDPDGWKSGIMILIAFALLYMAIKKQFEPSTPNGLTARSIGLH